MIATLTYNSFKPKPDEGKIYGKGPEGCIYLPKLLPNEVEFLHLVSENMLSSVEKYLEDHPALNINCVNFQVSFLTYFKHYNQDMYR